MLLNCDPGENAWSPLDSKEIKPVNPEGNQPEHSLEGQMLKLSSSTLGAWCEELTHWKRPCCWERLKAGGEGDNRGWNGWMASLTQWTWVWASSGSWWWTGKPGVLQSMGSQRVGHNWLTELNCTELVTPWSAECQAPLSSTISRVCSNSLILSRLQKQTK